MTFVGTERRMATATLLSGHTGILDSLLKTGVTNSAVCFNRLRKNGFSSRRTIVKDYNLIVTSLFIFCAVAKLNFKYSKRNFYFLVSTKAFSKLSRIAGGEGYNHNHRPCRWFAQVLLAFYQPSL